MESPKHMPHVTLTEVFCERHIPLPGPAPRLHPITDISLPAPLP